MKKILPICLLVLLFQQSNSQFITNTTNEGSVITPNPLTQSIDYPENLAKALFTHPNFSQVWGTNKLAVADAVAFGTTSASQQNKVYWNAGTALNNYLSGFFTISTDKFVDAVDIAITTNANNIGTMYVFSSEILNNTQYRYIRSYIWNGTDFIFQNKEDLTASVPAGAVSLSIDINYSGNFAITWEGNIGTIANPIWNVYGKVGKTNTSFPYYTLSNTIDVSLVSGLSTPTTAISHIYPDVSINNNSKVSFTFSVYPNQVKVVVVEGSVNFANFQYTYSNTRSIGSYSSFILLYKPKICYWKNYPAYHPNWIQYFNNDYGIVYSVLQQGQPSTYDLISLTSYNGSLTIPRVLNSLGNLNTILAGIQEHSIVPFEVYEPLGGNTPAFEISTEFEDRTSLVYGTSNIKLISRTIRLDNTQPTYEHNESGNPNYYVISHQNIASNDVVRSTMEGDPVNSFAGNVSFIKFGNFTAPSEIINSAIYSCGNYCFTNVKSNTKNSNLTFNTYLNSLDKLKDNNIPNKNNDLKKEISIYPNPSNGIIKINFDHFPNKNIEELYQIDVINNAGIKISSYKNIQYKSNLDLSNLSNGIYFLRIYNNNFSKTEKISIIK